MVDRESLGMELPLADRVRNSRQSDIRRYSAICAAMGGANLSQGVCDQPAPIEIKEAAKAAIDADEAIYTNLNGTSSLRRAIAKKLSQFNKIDVDPENQIVVTVGTAGAFACAVMATLDPGDECIVFSPFYGYHVNLLKCVGAVPRYVDMAQPDWTYSTDQLEAAITERTKMILVNTPANPTGKVFGKDELARIVDLANRNNLWIVTDEIYEYITHDVPHISPATLPGAADRTITISGASKTYAVTGWRIGYAAGPAAIIEKMAVVSDLFYICAPAPLQAGIEAGLALPDEYYQRMCEEYRAKRDIMAQTLSDIGFRPFVPAGSYYMLADFGGRWANATEATEAILDRVGVATVPGPAFYRNPQDGNCQLRFCYAKKLPELEDACRRLHQLGSG